MDTPDEKWFARTDILPESRTTDIFCTITIALDLDNMNMHAANLPTNF